METTIKKESVRDWSIPIKGSEFTPEMARDFLIEMCKRGCGFETKFVNGNDEFTLQYTKVPKWDRSLLYRLPPTPRTPRTPRTEPFNQLTVPKGALWREGEYRYWLHAVSYADHEVYFADVHGTTTYASLYANWQYSTDGGVTWHKAERRVE